MNRKGKNLSPLNIKRTLAFIKWGMTSLDIFKQEVQSHSKLSNTLIAIPALNTWLGSIKIQSSNSILNFTKVGDNRISQCNVVFEYDQLLRLQ